ncbi:MAG TPA: DNA-directed RNA polymerase subunit alpha C-terminal domain-containing protein [Candidatus Saccharimonadales bacterium]|nr:DNA-directed RNA polymerase subunit alpha C-terminal domain-containing protein [Candidatus Saccharimonadales bacterium]
MAVINGNFLEGHWKGFAEGVATGWEAGYLRALQDTGAAPVGPRPQPSGIRYISPTNHIDEELVDLYKEGRLSVRAIGCLHGIGLRTIGDLVSCTESQVLDIRNMGPKTLDEIKALLTGMDLALKE